MRAERNMSLTELGKRVDESMEFDPRVIWQAEAL